MARKYWLMDQHGEDGPTALVQTDGRLQIVDVVRFGPSITELADQQSVWDSVIGKVAPTMRPLVDASSLREEGVEPHEDLLKGDLSPDLAGRSSRRGNKGRSSSGRTGGGPSRTRSRGER